MMRRDESPAEWQARMARENAATEGPDQDVSLTECEIHGFKWKPHAGAMLCPICAKEHWHDKWLEQGDDLVRVKLLASEALAQLRALAVQLEAAGMIVPPAVREVISKAASP